MPPAARIADPTAHGKPLSPGPGSPDVLIGGLPAWRAIIDSNSCPLHGEGRVLVGSKNVLINNFPAARLGDMVVEGIIQNAIIGGCLTVEIG